MFTITFWEDAGKRALRTFVQTLSSTLLLGLVGVGSVWGVGWTEILTSSTGAALLAALISLLMSLQRVTDDEDQDEEGPAEDELDDTGVTENGAA